MIRGTKYLVFIVLMAAIGLGKDNSITLIPAGFKRTINCIHQDKTGYLWLGTVDGLYQYNGKDFISHKIDPYTKNSISDDHILDIDEDNAGNLFIGTKFGGLNLYNPGKKSFRYFTDNTFSGLEILSVLYANEATYFGTDAGLFALQDNGDTLMATGILLKENIVDLATTGSRTLIAATAENGVYVLNLGAGSTDIKNQEHYLKNFEVNFIYPLKLNSFLISTSAGFYLFNEENMRVDTIDQSIFSEKIYTISKNAIVRDRAGNIWLGSGYKLYKISLQDSFESVEIETFEINIDQRFSRGISNLFYDNSGVLWISFKGKGLYKYYPERKFSHYSLHQGLMSDVIFSMTEHNSNSVILGTHHGLYVYNFKEHSTYRIPNTEALDFQVITALCKDNLQNLWCGTNNGLYKLTPGGQLVQYQHSPNELSGLSSNFITTIVADPKADGDIWVGTRDGLNRYRSRYDNFVHYYANRNRQNSLLNDEIEHLYLSSAGVLWIATANGGLSKLTPEEKNNYDPAFVNYTNDRAEKSSISDNKITYITEDKFNDIWIGTENGGLNKLDSAGNFSHFLETNGLIDNHILSIVPAGNQFLWIATPGGIVRFDVKNLVFKNYLFKDGIKNGIFLNKSCAITRDGYILFGSKSGFTYFHPDNILNNTFAAQPVIAGFYVFNQPVKTTGTKVCRLDYDQNVISFEVCGLHYVSPEENRLSYYLEGVDEEWKYCSNFKYLTYSNLEPGMYTLHLKAANNDNIWNENEAILQFQIIAPFWDKLWFKLMIICLTLALFYLIMRYRMNKVNKRKFMLEKQISEKIKINEELNQALARVEVLKNKLEDENTFLKEEIEIKNYSTYKDIVTDSKKMRTILQQVEIAAGADPTILILGESGTGKDLLAHAIHKSSSRSKECFIKVDCASLPPTLIESELFGHEKGAFTGANKQKIGRFELANGGTVFLDEIGELPIKVQQKLLRVLQNGEFERLGNSVTLRTNTRIIAATNRNLENEVEKGRFREDLFYRLNVFPINLPPLRERMEDIPILVKHFLTKYSDKFNKRITKIPQKTITELMAYSWPGNIRELENIIQRAIIISRDEMLELGSWFDSVKTRCEEIPDNHFMSLEELQKRHIEKILEYTNGKVSGENGAAEILKINPKTLFSRMKKLNINN